MVDFRAQPRRPLTATTTATTLEVRTNGRGLATRHSARSVGSTTPPGRPAYESKLGLPDRLDDAVLSPLLDQLFALLQQSHVDHTSIYRGLSAAARGDAEPTRGLFPDLAALDGWVQRWRPWVRRRRDGPGQAGTSPATTSSRRPSPPRPTATWIRSNGSWTQWPPPTTSVLASSSTPPSPRRTSAPTGLSAGPEFSPRCCGEAERGATIVEWIEAYYDPRGRHSSLGYPSQCSSKTFTPPRSPRHDCLTRHVRRTVAGSRMPQRCVGKA